MSSYLLPFDTIFNVWWTAVPVYDLEPVVPPVDNPTCPVVQQDSADDTAANAAAADVSESSDDETSEQALKWVFKGVKWIPVSAYNIRENLYYNLLQERQRDEDDQRSLARKPAPPPQVLVEREDAPDEVGTDPAEPPSDASERS